MKRILCFVLALLMMPLLVACDTGEMSGTRSSVETTTEPREFLDADDFFDRFFDDGYLDDEDFYEKHGMTPDEYFGDEYLEEEDFFDKFFDDDYLDVEDYCEKYDMTPEEYYFWESVENEYYERKKEKYPESLTSLPAVGAFIDRLTEDQKVFRSLLTEEEKAFYDMLLPYAFTYTSFRFDLREPEYEWETIRRACRAIHRDYPEAWLFFYYGRQVLEKGEYLAAGGRPKYTLHLIRKYGEQFDPNFMTSYLKRIHDVCDGILARMPKDMSLESQYLWLADRVCEIAEYDYALSGDYTQADGLFLYGKGVCQSYAYAYQWLCQKAGLWCTTCSGMAYGEGHMWNVVKLSDGKTYYMDLTWADASSYPYGEYFMTYEQLIKDRIPDEGEWIADGDIYR